MGATEVGGRRETTTKWKCKDRVDQSARSPKNNVWGSIRYSPVPID